MMNCLAKGLHMSLGVGICATHLVPADAAPVWQHRMRISLTAGDKALANDDMVVNDEVEVVAVLPSWRISANIGETYHAVSST